VGIKEALNNEFAKKGSIYSQPLTLVLKKHTIQGYPK
jgi:hypothetical protein